MSDTYPYDHIAEYMVEKTIDHILQSLMDQRWTWKSIHSLQYTYLLTYSSIVESYERTGSLDDYWVNKTSALIENDPIYQQMAADGYEAVQTYMDELGGRYLIFEDACNFVVFSDTHLDHAMIVKLKTNLVVFQLERESFLFDATYIN